MSKFDRTDDFRSSATEKDYQDLLEAYTGLKSTEWGTLSDTYGFSRSSALNLLREKNLIDRRRMKQSVESENRTQQSVSSQRSVSSRKRTQQSVELMVQPKTLKTKLRPTRMTDQTWNKLNSVLTKYSYINRENVLDALLNEVLDKYL